LENFSSLDDVMTLINAGESKSSVAEKLNIPRSKIELIIKFDKLIEGELQQCCYGDDFDEKYERCDPKERDEKGDDGRKEVIAKIFREDTHLSTPISYHQRDMQDRVQ